MFSSFILRLTTGICLSFLLADVVQIPWFEHICWDELGMKRANVIESSPT